MRLNLGEAKDYGNLVWMISGFSCQSSILTNICPGC
jgi:hypothetical protein